MNRRNAFTIEITDWNNSDFWKLISESENEGCLYDQPDLKKDGIVWFKDVPKELFKFEGCFEWISGSVRLWYNGEPVTRQNYRTVISGEDEPVKYDYINWYRMSVEAPETKE